MSNVKLFLQQSWLLIAASFFFGLLIAITNAGLQPNIKRNEQKKIEERLTELINEAQSFEAAIQDAEIALSKAKRVKTDIYKAVDADGKTIGFAYIAEGAGFTDKIKLIIAVNGNFEKFYGFKVLFSNETPGFGDKIKDDYYIGQFIGAPAGQFQLVKTGDYEKIDSEIVAISGATVSSTAVVNIFNSYTEKIKELLISKGLIEDGR